MADHTSAGASSALTALLTPLALDNPRDGDCIAVAELVTDKLLEHGLDASTATIAGWHDRSEKILGFFHHVTVHGGMVLDGTARQFDPSLPPAWVLPLPAYLGEIADATGVDHATVFSSTARPAQDPDPGMRGTSDRNPA
ncbi:hypothetical protein [Nocardia brasiliensis]|uniref:hypothetical protein n=1 Tax=Nocardia brasiliensis TaxID=37326 RepID=UPI0024555EE7|nr:hypothetical protein [Nocardia brasiliensis]